MSCMHENFIKLKPAQKMQLFCFLYGFTEQMF